MKTVEFNQLSEAPKFIEKCYNRVTQNLINCPVRIVSRAKLGEADIDGEFVDFPWDRYEREAKRYYESKGYKVIRLEHFASDGVGENERTFPTSKTLGNYLRKYFSASDYEKYISKKQVVKKAIALNEVYPTDYAISSYPPDFLVVNEKWGVWKFVEVKGPKDKLRFRQANWFVNLIPKEWKYEIFASLEREFGEEYYLNLPQPRNTEKFNDLLENEIQTVDAWNKKFKR